MSEVLEKPPDRPRLSEYASDARDRGRKSRFGKVTLRSPILIKLYLASVTLSSAGLRFRTRLNQDEVIDFRTSCKIGRVIRIRTECVLKQANIQHVYLVFAALPVTSDALYAPGSDRTNRSISEQATVLCVTVFPAISHKLDLQRLESVAGHCTGIRLHKMHISSGVSVP
jgi:hypothetical protein